MFLSLKIRDAEKIAMEKGREEGRAEGLAEGRAEGRAEKIDIIKNMIAGNMEDEEIIKFTKISAEELAALKENS